MTTRDTKPRKIVGNPLPKVRGHVSVGAHARSILFWLAIIALLIYSVFPIYWLVLSSLRPPDTIVSEISLWPSKVTLNNYRDLNRHINYGQQYWNSLVVSVVVTVATMLISTFVSYAIARRKFRGRKVLSATLLFSYMFPPLLSLIPLYVAMVHLRLADTILGLAIAELAITMPLGIWMLWGFFNSMPFELEEAAMVDGCSRLGAFVKIILPLAKPGLVTVGIFSFLISWNGYTAPSILVTSDETKTVPVGLVSVAGNMASQWGMLMAACTLVILPLIAGFLFLNRYFIQGLVGGIKG
jgi:ABC-type glycerol-3-phosphate transport system permease component